MDIVARANATAAVYAAAEAATAAAAEVSFHAPFMAIKKSVLSTIIRCELYIPHPWLEEALGEPCPCSSNPITEAHGNGVKTPYILG